MLTVMQRVTEAHVVVDNTIVGQINQGLLILCGFEKQDEIDTLQRMLDKCLNYRVFADRQGKMNKSLKEIAGGLLLVPQFTLVANTSRGLRPSFSLGAPAELGCLLFAELTKLARQCHPAVAAGQFGADMKVHLCNDGPVTFTLKF